MWRSPASASGKVYIQRDYPTLRTVQRVSYFTYAPTVLARFSNRFTSIHGGETTALLCPLLTSGYLSDERAVITIYWLVFDCVNGRRLQVRGVPVPVILAAVTMTYYRRTPLPDDQGGPPSPKQQFLGTSFVVLNWSEELKQLVPV